MSDEAERPWDEHPVLATDRLRLRAVVESDAADIQRLANDIDVARMTAVIPHPYEDGVAEEWIASSRTDYETGRGSNFAITLRETAELIGVCGIGIAAAHDRGEFGYWIGRPYWGNGYATEAARALVAHAFGDLGLNRLQAGAFTHNPASIRVLEKVGLREEGVRRQLLKRFGEYGDVVLFGLLREDYEENA